VVVGLGRPRISRARIVALGMHGKGRGPSGATRALVPLAVFFKVAFVVGTQRVTSERVQQLAQQARGIGLIRVLVVADAGLSADAPHAKRGVRVLDRNSLSAELAKLDISVAAKIIAVARKRSSARASVG